MPMYGMLYIMFVCMHVYVQVCVCVCVRVAKKMLTCGPAIQFVENHDLFEGTPGKHVDLAENRTL